MRQLVILGMLGLLLVGCQEQPFSEGNEQAAEAVLSTTPPALELTIGEVVIRPQRGGYAWHYEENGQMVVVQTDHLAPEAMVDATQSTEVSRTATVQLQSAAMPERVEWRLWQDGHVVHTYEQLADIAQQGTFVVELVGYWATGSRVSYVTVLTFT